MMHKAAEAFIDEALTVIKKHKARGTKHEARSTRLKERWFVSSTMSYVLGLKSDHRGFNDQPTILFNGTPVFVIRSPC